MTPRSKGPPDNLLWSKVSPPPDSLLRSKLSPSEVYCPPLRGDTLLRSKLSGGHCYMHTHTYFEFEVWILDYSVTI